MPQTGSTSGTASLEDNRDVTSHIGERSNLAWSHSAAAPGRAETLRGGGL
jgi:hypothetical protein